MHNVRERVVIGRSPACAWQVLSVFDGIASWASNVDHASLTTDHADGVGAVRRVQVGRTALLERIVEWHPGSILAYEIEGLPTVVRSVTNRWTLEPGEPGTTLVVLTSEIAPAGPRAPHQVAARVVGRMLGRASRTMLDGFKHEVERQATR